MKRFACILLLLILIMTPALQETKTDRVTFSTGDDNIIDVLVIGNSFCTGWQDELRGMLHAAGTRVIFSGAIHPGSSLSQHCEWARNGDKEYRFRSYRSSAKSLNKYPVDLEYCLSRTNWDVISIQEAFFSLVEEECDEAEIRRNTKALASELYGYIRSRCPQATLVWNQTWAVEVGWHRNQYSVETQADQDYMYRVIREIGDEVAAENGAYVAPTGTAFQIARANGSGDLSRDGCHDGTVTGGQYLNACVWFEFITGESCIGNTWRPTKYTLSEERITLLQQAAHAAVCEYMGK